ncbi:MAG: hypothetical protein HFH56_06315 [Lachnospiraceae bacterium]|jgi:hypothetical protein|nr:hypothetical protein [Lachnospiraceae bacterium]
MPKKKDNKKRSWQNKRLHRYNDPNLWKVGEPLTEKDERLLSVLKKTYKQLGYTPSQKEVPNAPAIKKRFRLWSDAILAAGLPKYSDIEQIRKREAKKAWEKRTNDLLR